MAAILVKFEQKRPGRDAQGYVYATETDKYNLYTIEANTMGQAVRKSNQVAAANQRA